MMLKIKEFDIRLIYESAFEYSFYYIEFNDENFLNTQTLRFKSDTILIEVEKELIDSLNKEVIWLTIQTYNNSIYFIRFKNIKLAMNFYTCVFLGEIKDGHIELNMNIKRFLLKKFKINNFDSFTKNPIHIKFLVEYSPILSKFVDPSEFDDIEFINLRGNVNGMWKDAYYVDFSENVKFFKVNDVLYEKGIFSIDITRKFLKVLESWGK